MVVGDIIKNKPYLAWEIHDPSKLSDQSVLEHVLTYGNWEDVQTLCTVMGKEKARILFNKSLKNKRVNYPPEIKSYFTRYFNLQNADSHSQQ